MFEMYFFWKGRLFLKKGPSSQENLHVDLYSPSSLWCLRYPLLSKVTSEPSLSQISLAMHLNIHRFNYYILDLHPLDWEDWGRTKILIFIWIKPEVQPSILWLFLYSPCSDFDFDQDLFLGQNTFKTRIGRWQTSQVLGVL